MSQACPTCGKPVDPLRSRFVGVRDGKVVAYDSEACRAAAETKPTVMPVVAKPAVAKPETKAEAKAKTRTPASGIPSGTSPSVETGPVIEIVKAKDKPTPPPIEDGSLDHWASGDEAHDDDDDGDAPKSKRARTPLPIAPQKRTGLVIALVVVLAGAGAFLAYRFLVMKSEAPADTTPEKAPAAPPRPAPPPDKPKQVTPAQAVTQAHEVLVKNLGSESPRVQRVAAAALARTGDAQALALLGTALGKETSDVSRLDLAYALARAGDKKGIDALVAGTQSTRRDVRIEAARKLAAVGDKRAAPVLAGYLDVEQLRLGAAEALAVLADPAAIKALVAVRSDAKSSADEKARATIALGIAGKSDVIPDLQALLKDQRFNAFAASALALLHDASAKPVLVEQLGVPALRVEAARALRRLEPALDPAPYLPPLIAELTSKKDTDQISVAEAILLLAGDAGWSERP